MLKIPKAKQISQKFIYLLFVAIFEFFEKNKKIRVKN
jgi:hypothetical protein